MVLVCVILVWTVALQSWGNEITWSHAEMLTSTEKKRDLNELGSSLSICRPLVTLYIKAAAQMPLAQILLKIIPVKIAWRMKAGIWSILKDNGMLPTQMSKAIQLYECDFNFKWAMSSNLWVFGIKECLAFGCSTTILFHLPPVPFVDLQTLENLTSAYTAGPVVKFGANRKELPYPKTWIQWERHETWTENVKANLKRLDTEIHHTSIKTAQKPCLFLPYLATRHMQFLPPDPRRIRTFAPLSGPSLPVVRCETVKAPLRALEVGMVGWEFPIFFSHESNMLYVYIYNM